MLKGKRVKNKLLKIQPIFSINLYYNIWMLTFYTTNYCLYMLLYLESYINFSFGSLWNSVMKKLHIQLHHQWAHPCSLCIAYRISYIYYIICLFFFKIHIKSDRLLSFAGIKCCFRKAQFYTAPYHQWINWVKCRHLAVWKNASKNMNTLLPIKVESFCFTSSSYSYVYT